jgi:hypothetical protein
MLVIYEDAFVPWKSLGAREVEYTAFSRPGEADTCIMKGRKGRLRRLDFRRLKFLAGSGLVCPHIIESHQNHCRRDDLLPH